MTDLSKITEMMKKRAMNICEKGKEVMKAVKWKLTNDERGKNDEMVNDENN